MSVCPKNLYGLNTKIRCDHLFPINNLCLLSTSQDSQTAFMRREEERTRKERSKQSGRKGKGRGQKRESIEEKRNGRQEKDGRMGGGKRME